MTRITVHLTNGERVVGFAEVGTAKVREALKLAEFTEVEVQTGESAAIIPTRNILYVEVEAVA